MKIPHHLIPALLVESAAFRSYVAEILTDASDTKEKVRNLILNADGKIDAIKKVREFFSFNKNEFKAAYPNVEINPAENGYPECIGLANTKRFVESFKDFN